MGAVVRNMEPELGLVACLRSNDEYCAITPACSLKAILSDATTQFLATLDQRTLSDITLAKPRISRLLQLGKR